MYCIHSKRSLQGEGKVTAGRVKGRCRVEKVTAGQEKVTAGRGIVGVT